MKNKYTLSILVLVILTANFSCKKTEESIQKPFSLDGIWQMNGYFLDSTGKLFYAHTAAQFMRFYADSVNHNLNNSLQTNLLGKYKLHAEDTSIDVEISNGVFSPIVGKKFQVNFTKETYYTSDSNYISVNRTSHREDVLNIVNRDSIFGYSYCCRSFFSLIKL